MLLALGLLEGCRPRNTYVPPPPPEVMVTQPQQRSVTLYHEYTGNTQASDSVEVRSRVAGYLNSIHFQDGSTVVPNQLLFIIDPRPYRALLDQTNAVLESRRATVIQQESVYRRDLALLSSHAVTQEQADIDRGNWLVAQAAAMEAEAAVRQAQLNLSYTEIHAPQGGRVGRRLVDVGNLVSPDATLLTTIMRYDPMYVYFNTSEANYLDYLRRRREQDQKSDPAQPSAPPGGSPTTGSAPAAQTPAAQTTTSGSAPAAAAANPPAKPPRTPLELGLANETGYPHRGYIDFAESSVDPNTGTLLLRGVFANPQPYFLAPGLFARIRVPIGTQAHALLVPEIALGADQAGRFLLVVRPDDMVERRSVKVGTSENGMRIIEEGLKPDERFIVEGLQRARPGMKVKPVPANAPQPTASPASGDTQRR